MLRTDEAVKCGVVGEQSGAGPIELSKDLRNLLMGIPPRFALA